MSRTLQNFNKATSEGGTKLTRDELQYAAGIAALMGPGLEIDLQEARILFKAVKEYAANGRLDSDAAKTWNELLRTGSFDHIGLPDDFNVHDGFHFNPDGGF
jgi:hypothetical protein